MKTHHTYLTIEQMPELRALDTIKLDGLEGLTVIDPLIPPLRKGGQIIQRSAIVETDSGSRRLLLVAIDRPPALVHF